MVDCSSDRDIECGREEESVELQGTPPETPTSPSSSPSEWSARGEPVPIVQPIRCSPNHSAVDLAHETLQGHPNEETLVKSVDIGTVSLGPVDFLVNPLEENSTNSTSMPNQSQQTDYATSTSTTLDDAAHGRLRRRSKHVRFEDTKQNWEAQHAQACHLRQISEESDEEVGEEADGGGRSAAAKEASPFSRKSDLYYR
ncbi:hypothetical protein V5O48_013299, partial [Marasmius crinis-equi]